MEILPCLRLGLSVIVLLAACDGATTPDVPDETSTCRLPPADYAAITTHNSVQAPDEPAEHMQFSAFVSAFSFNQGQEVSATADISFDLVGVFDLDGEPFALRAFCTASGWNWRDP